MPFKSNNEKFTKALGEILAPTHLFTDPADCLAYGYDNSRRQTLPAWVAFPTQHEDVLSIVRLCNEYQIPLTARGLGTGTPGGSVPVEGGLVLSFERMNRILNCDPANRMITVEPGVINKTLQEAAMKHGLFWPPDPSSAAFCTVGGNLAYNSAGPRAVKYGTPRENTLGLRAVTGDGLEIKTGVHTTKGVVGYDLTRLLIGSEGTLAIITEATLKLTPLPESKQTFCAIYQDVQSATTAITHIMMQPITPCALEFIDGPAIEMIRGYAKIKLPHNAGAMLLIDVDGPASAMPNAITHIQKAATTAGLLEMHTAKNNEEADALWDLRKALSPALRTIAPKKINEDVVVPVSRIPELISGIETLAKHYQITIINFGHAGNGNIHVNLLVNPEDPTELDHAQKCLSEIFTLVLNLGGTLSGEHGVGLEKKQFITAEIDPTTLDLMKKIKQQFDPKGILNPGKIFPDN